MCVIGGGFAGLAVAERCVAGGASCLVLEHGPSDVPFSPVLTVGDADCDVEGNRAAGLGGTSSKWNGVSTRLEPSVYAEWPLRPDELQPYLDQAEQWLGVEGLPAVDGAEPPRTAPLASPGLPLRPEHLPTLAAYRPVVMPFSFADGTARRLATCDAPRIEAAGAVITPASRVLRLKWHPRQPTRVEAIGLHGPFTVFADAVVVACGVVASFELLRSSTSRRHPTGLGNHHGQLGRGFNAHPRRRCTTDSIAHLNGVRGVLRSYTVGERFVEAGLGRVVLDVNTMDTSPMLDVTIEQEMTDGNRLDLADGRIAVHHHLSPRDAATVAAADDLLGEVAHTLGVAHGEITTRWFHPAGGCRMAADAQHGVVDPNSEVFGAPGIFVTGASTFPTCGASNPTLTVTAMGLRLGDHLASRR